VSNPAEVDDVARFALSALRAATAGTKPPEVPILSDRTSVGNASDYSGQFDGEKGSLRVRTSGSRLTLNIGRKDVAMEKREDDTFLANYPGLDIFMMRFERENGKVTRIIHGPDVYERHGHMRDSKTRLPKSAEEFEGHYRSYNPWLSNFRIISRKGKLVFVDPSGKEQDMSRLPDGSFRIGDAASPERVRFDSVVCGKASHAVLSGGDFYRTFTP
jgi:hypothetical protein